MTDIITDSEYYDDSRRMEIPAVKIDLDALIEKALNGIEINSQLELCDISELTQLRDAIHRRCEVLAGLGTVRLAIGYAFGVGKNPDAADQLHLLTHLSWDVDYMIAGLERRAA